MDMAQCENLFSLYHVCLLRCGTLQVYDEFLYSCVRSVSVCDADYEACVSGGCPMAEALDYNPRL